MDLVALLERAGIDPRATHLWSYGLDYGDSDGYGEISHYVKDMPLSRLDEGEVLIAYELNGELLAAKNGYPTVIRPLFITMIQITKPTRRAR